MLFEGIFCSQIQEWMRAAGMQTWVDDVRNVHGRINSANASATVLLIGSHYDTVYDAGKYDGALGIVVGIAAAKALVLSQVAASGVDLSGLSAGAVKPAVVGAGSEEGVVELDLSMYMLEGFVLPGLQHHLEVIAFSDEEGMRFQTTFLGSRAVAGMFAASAENQADMLGKLRDIYTHTWLYTPLSHPRGHWRWQRNVLLGYGMKYYLVIIVVGGHHFWLFVFAGGPPYTVGPQIIESFWAEKRVSTGALGALDDPPVVQTNI